MHEDDHESGGFEEMLRSIAQELGRSVEQAADRIDVEEIAERIGIDPIRAREWVDLAATWLRTEAETVAEDVARSTSRPSGPVSAHSAPAEDPLRGARPHPLDVPSDEQGMALAGLESRRWEVEVGSDTLVVTGDGPGPSDGLGLYRELRARDWIASDGSLTLAGRHALSRWLASSLRKHG